MVLEVEMIPRARSQMLDRLGLDLIDLRYCNLITRTFALLVFHSIYFFFVSNRFLHNYHLKFINLVRILMSLCE